MTRALTKKAGLWEKTDVFAQMVIAPVEIITRQLNRGDEFTAESSALIEKLIQRGKALEAAYQMRVDKECEVIE